MTNDQIKARIYAKIDEIPTLPVVIPKILNLTESPKSQMHDLIAVISNDPALTSNILKIANSAYYGFPQHIDDLERGIKLIGFQMVRSLALSLGVMQSLPSRAQNRYYSHEGIWIHSLAVANALQSLDPRRPHLFILGLLHDIGKIVLDQFFPEQFGEALEMVQQEEDLPIYRAEERAIGCDHGTVAGILLKRWKFPEEIRLPIKYHHAGEPDQGVDLRDIALLHIADALAQQVGLGESGNAKAPMISDADLELAGIKRDQLDQLGRSVEAAQSAIYGFFNAIS